VRILHLASEYPPHQVYGLGRYVCDLSRELAHQGHAVHVLTNSHCGAPQDAVDNGVGVHRVDAPMPPKPPGSIAPVLAFNLCLQRRAQALGRAGLGEPEVLVSHDYLTAPAGHRLARRWGIPHVWTVHDAVHGKLQGAIRCPDDQAVFDIETWAAGTADLVLANSRAVRLEMLTVYGAPSSRTRVLHCGIASTRFDPSQPPQRVAAFRQMLASPEEVLLTYVGRLDQEKGIDTLVNALALAR